jgi:hypothetical protein
MTYAEVAEYEQVLAQVAMACKELARVNPPAKDEPSIGENKAALLAALLARAKQALAADSMLLDCDAPLLNATYSDACLRFNQVLVALQQRRLRLLTRAHGKYWWAVKTDEGDRLMPVSEQVIAALATP